MSCICIEAVLDTKLMQVIYLCQRPYSEVVEMMLMPPAAALGPCQLSHPMCQQHEPYLQQRWAMLKVVQITACRQEASRWSDSRQVSRCGRSSSSTTHHWHPELHRQQWLVVIQQSGKQNYHMYQYVHTVSGIVPVVLRPSMNYDCLQLVLSIGDNLCCHVLVQVQCWGE